MRSAGQSPSALDAIRTGGRDEKLNMRRDARVAEGARLEIVCTERYRGFESLSLLGLRQDSAGGLAHAVDVADGQVDGDADRRSGVGVGVRQCLSIRRR